MIYLYKLNGNILTKLVPNSVAPSQEEITSYGIANGGKTLVQVEQPSKFHTLSYTEDETTITEVWTQKSLEVCKQIQINENNAASNNSNKELMKNLSTSEVYVYKSPPEAIERIYSNMAEVTGAAVEKQYNIMQDKINKYNITIVDLIGTVEKNNEIVKNSTNVSQIESASLTVEQLSSTVNTMLIDSGFEKNSKSYSIANFVMDGTNYHDTKIKLFKENKDFSILIKFTIDPIVASSTDQIALFHCLLERTPFPGITLQTDIYNAATTSREFVLSTNLGSSLVLDESVLSEGEGSSFPFNGIYNFLLTREASTGKIYYALFNEDGTEVLKTAEDITILPEGSYQERSLILGAANMQPYVDQPDIIQRNCTGIIFNFDYYDGQILTNTDVGKIVYHRY